MKEKHSSVARSSKKIWLKAPSYLSLVQDKNPVVVGHCIDPVRHGEDCALCERLPDCILDHWVRLYIYWCCSFVKKKDFVLPENILINWWKWKCTFHKCVSHLSKALARHISCFSPTEKLSPSASTTIDKELILLFKWDLSTAIHIAASSYLVEQFNVYPDGQW